ncbi:YeaC family protein [Psychrobium sp. 1_MG-2023]|uniref:YeaC family protein n=1 Tax=Psychrobium sp. 1_MG-2023 TaxID=3062624 RepID=UPI000C31C43C|nr:DUF1315 family protein [Psychrobium sp. 1_MG-2023]MDP2561535.1 DUF1315 family protein [Psychrobium sp. 1_MG-2023]PKF54998.1 DUF1315 domain-containing protein [Alteromonadales bacterium alter-6D02]
MQIEHLINNMSPAVYEVIKQGVEIGRWPNGEPLTEEQRDMASQAMMLYQGTHLEQTDHMTVAKGGTLNQHSKSQLRNQFNNDEITRSKV